MKVGRRVVTNVSIVGVAIGLLIGVSPTADAASGPIFTVMNTSETPPDGVYFRNSPHTADTSRITGLGVYKNERVQLECYATGDAVPPYNDKLWYRVNNVTRPTVGGRVNVGYLNAHYINDGRNANVVDAGVAKCGAVASPPPAPSATPRPAVSVARGTSAPQGYWYAITVKHFAANSMVSVSCRDSVDSAGFRTFMLATDGSGDGSAQSECYSGDGPDHWVTANGVESNHVLWNAAPKRVTPPAGSGSDRSGRSAGTTSSKSTAPARTAPETCQQPTGAYFVADKGSVAASLYKHFLDGSGTAAVIEWSYFSRSASFSNFAKAIPVGQTRSYRNSVHTDMFLALGSFLIKRSSADCYLVTDHYDFDPSFRSVASGVFTIIYLPDWALQFGNASTFDVASGGRL